MSETISYLLHILSLAFEVIITKYQKLDALQTTDSCFFFKSFSLCKVQDEDPGRFRMWLEPASLAPCVSLCPHMMEGAGESV